VGGKHTGFRDALPALEVVVGVVDLAGVGVVMLTSFRGTAAMVAIEKQMGTVYSAHLLEVQKVCSF
jgi:hypothetical protein